jgi:hypothetical protein
MIFGKLVFLRTRIGILRFSIRGRWAWNTEKVGKRYAYRHNLPRRIQYNRVFDLHKRSKSEECEGVTHACKKLGGLFDQPQYQVLRTRVPLQVS